jgi:hypothetical protein
VFSPFLGEVAECRGASRSLLATETILVVLKVKAAGILADDDDVFPAKA